MKRPKSGGSEHLTAPLLVMNNFNTPAVDDTTTDKQAPRVPKHLESLATSVFQSLFPPINPTATPLKGIKRVLLADRLRDTDSPSDAATYVLNLRHYAIETRTAKSVPKALRRLDAAEKLTHAGQKRKRGGLPNLGGLKDVSDYLLDPHAADGFTSGSESEPDTDAEVEIAASIARKVSKRKAAAKEGSAADKREAAKANVERKAIKLHELGPRLKLRLTKVEEGVCAGKVMWHEYIHKSKEEIREMEKYHEQRRREKEARKAEQKANVEKKKAERRARGETVDDDEEDEEFDDEDDDDQWDDEDGLEADNGGEDEEMVNVEEDDEEED
jgi:ribosome biogenesis protein SSF1/2